VAVILKPVSFGPSRGERQHRVFAIEGLDGRLLIDAETAACCGGCRYNPMISAALVSKSGSFEAM
jgi:hypothetical protein